MNDSRARPARRVHNLHSATPVLAFAMDRDGRLALLQANPAMAARHTVSQARGKYWSELGLPDPERIERAMRRVLNGEAVEFRLNAGDEQFEVSVWPTYDRTGEPVGAFGMARVRGASGIFGEEDSTRLRHTLDHIEDGYYETDLRGRLVLINEALARIAGRPREELLGEEWFYEDLADAGNVELARASFEQVYRTQVPIQSVEGEIRRPDGTMRTIDLSMSPVLNPRGRVVGFRGIVRDVSERRRLDDEIAVRVERLAVLEQVDTELGQTLDVDQVLTIAIRALVLLSHADAAEIAIRDERTGVYVLARQFGFNEVIELVPQTMGIVGRVLREMKPVLTPDVSADEDYYRVRETTRAQMTFPLIAHNRLLGVVSLETDDPARFTPEVFEFTNLLTARMAAAIENARLYQLSQGQLAELRDLYEQVSALEQIKTDMIRIASHDLRSPLGVIMGYLDLLQFDLDGQLNEEQRGFFDAMKRAADRMQRMTTDILALERAQTVRMQPHGRLQLDHLVRKVVDDFEDNAAHKGVKLVRDIPTERVPIVGDPISLSEAIGNLVSNAIKYTPSGGTVEVRLKRERKAAELLIVDNGIGIPEADQDKLFSPFYRVKNDETLGIDGTGLGLYLVRKIVEQHSGEIIFCSEHGKGSTFGFRIPVFVTSALETAQP
ncbi:MAG: PAS domain-containing protein [Anaerolineae bacterium]|nr:PAS domain-containing protein [Anaerolineae bacterium]